MKRIPLRARGGEVVAHALVDDADFDWLNRWRWCLDSRKSYARRAGRSGEVYMAREILGLQRGDPRMAEHKNRNGLDNRRRNLRIAERGHIDNKQNLGLYANNRSGFRGVSWYARSGKWRARCRINYKEHTIGYFDTPEEADEAVKAFRSQHMPYSQDASTRRSL